MFILEINSVGRSHLSKGYMCKHAQEMLPNLLIDLSNNNQRSVCLVFFFSVQDSVKGFQSKQQTANMSIDFCLMCSVCRELLTLNSPSREDLANRRVTQPDGQPGRARISPPVGF